jgi:hypothetical protein
MRYILRQAWMSMTDRKYSALSILNRRVHLWA